MKKIYLLILLITGFSYAQNTLIGEWYLDSFTIDNAAYNNVYAYINTIGFTEDVVFENYLEYNGSSSCNYFFGEYSATNNSVIFYSLGSSALDCYNEPRGTFEDMYFSLLSQNFSSSSEFSYSIEGTGEDQTLTLTNSNNDSIFYSKTQIPVNLQSTWYLETVIENGLTYNVSSTNSPSITLQNDPHQFFGTMTFGGTGVCNDYIGEYGMYYGNGDEIRIMSFTPTTNICEPPSAIETAYFSVLGDTSANLFKFEITNNGDNLVLTSVPDVLDRSPNAVDDVIILGNESLSVNDFKNSDIAIIKNPVQDRLELSIADNLLFQNINYCIYSADGKLVSKSKLSRKNINTISFSAGLYFISFENKNGVLTTLKFVKK